MREADERAGIVALEYRPSGRRLDVEIFRFSDLRRRIPAAQLLVTQRHTFHTLVCVTDGAPIQMVDFEPVACTAGTILVLRPGQVHSFGQYEDWDGWMVLFRSEFLPSTAGNVTELTPAFCLDRLPAHLSLSGSDFAAVENAAAGMAQDFGGGVAPELLHPLLRHQVSALLLRLTIFHHQSAPETVHSRNLERFTRFRALLDQNYSAWHQVSAYAQALGCTEKSLGRAALEVAGRGAKEVITGRIVLEAKRLLAHTDRPVNLIAEGLGFPEPTNFSKFFRRETGTAPGDFRRRYEQR